jgi:hypothetical protein
VISHGFLMIGDVTLKGITHLASSKGDIDMSFECRPERYIMDLML